MSICAALNIEISRKYQHEVVGACTPLIDRLWIGSVGTDGLVTSGSICTLQPQTLIQGNELILNNFISKIEISELTCCILLSLIRS